MATEVILLGETRFSLIHSPKHIASKGLGKILYCSIRGCFSPFEVT